MARESANQRDGSLIRLGPIFTKPSNTFPMAFKKVLEGFVARIP